MAVKGARPDRLRVTPHLIVRDANAAMKFYARALGAAELYRSSCPGSKAIHLHVKIGDSVVLVSEEDPDIKGHTPEYMGLACPEALGGTTVVLQLYVDDVDAVYKRAIDAGASPTMPPQDRYWGDRYSLLTDPSGYVWGLATVVEELTPEEIEKRSQGFLAHSAPFDNR